MGFSRQEYWNGFLHPPPGDLPDPGVEPVSLTLQQIVYQLSYQGSLYIYIYIYTHTHTHIYIHTYTHIYVNFPT